MNWTQLGVKLLTNLPKIQTVIESVKGLKGPDKRAAVINAVVNGLDVAQDLTDRSILRDPRVLAVLSRANDVAVELQNIIALVSSETRKLDGPLPAGGKTPE